MLKIIIQSIFLNWVLVSIAIASVDRAKVTPVKLSIKVIDDIQFALQDHLVWDRYNRWAPGLNWNKLREIYQKRSFSPVWLNYFGPTEKARIVQNVVQAAEAHGLEPEEYHAPAIKQLFKSKSSRDLARLELLLTDALIRYSVEVSVGYEFPRSADFAWYLKPKKANVDSKIEQVLTASDLITVLGSFPPRHDGYIALKSKLSFYRMLAMLGEWKKIPRGPTLQLGVKHSNVILLRQRLFREEYISNQDDLNSSYFDEKLELAVREFQSNYGHKPDGIVGYFTRTSLNVSLANRIISIKQNMERWRWLPDDLGEKYIMVNMAGYTLDYVNNSQVSLSMPVIVGKPYRSTPAFSDTMKYIEFNPTWKVPTRIAKEKFLPNIKQNMAYLSKNNLRVYRSWRKGAKEINPLSINWNNMSDDHFPYKLVQDPGKYNSMGQVKFMFPNSFRVYLHDTPNKNLFNRYVRTFSSGCIRVSQPFLLAQKLLFDQKDWSLDKIKTIIRKGETTRVKLKQRVPVYLMYWTAWVTKDGKVNFRKDVYQRNNNIVVSNELNLS